MENDAKESSSVGTLDKVPAAASSVSISKTNWWEDLGDEDVDLEDLSKAFSEATSLSSQPKKMNSNQNSESAVKHSSPLTAQTRGLDTDIPGEIALFVMCCSSEFLYVYNHM